MRVLVTRPPEDAQRTAAELRARGHAVVVAPLVEIRFRDGPPLALENVQAILATSANGLRALARRTQRRDIPVFAVGPQTAEAAQQLGFLQVKNAQGDAAALADAAKRWARPDGGALFHPGAAKTKGGLEESLRRTGFTVVNEILYDAVQLNELPPAAVDALSAGALDAALLFSPRSARTLAEAVQRAGLVQACSGLEALCISRATADALAPLRFRAVRVAARPDQNAILALLA